MADNLSHLRNMKRRLTQNKPSANMSPLEKVDMLEKTLSTFRSEVNMKLQIMQQILTTRNEQVSVQKKLLDREQNLYNVLLGHWMNTPNLAASGLSMNFSAEFEESGEDFDYENEENLSDPDYSAGEELSAGPSRKKSKSSLRRQRKSGRIVPKQNQTQQAQDQGEYHHAPDADDGSDDGADEPGNQVEVQMKGEYDTEDTATLGTGMNEFNEFIKALPHDHDLSPVAPNTTGTEVNFTEQEISVTSTRRSPIWKHFIMILESGNNIAKCKYCASGKYTVSEKSNKSTGNLIRHIQKHHSDKLAGENLTSQSQSHDAEFDAPILMQ